MDDLIKQVASDDSKIRKAAAKALGQRREKHAVDALIEALDKNSNMSEAEVAVALALGEIGDPRAVERLVKMLDHWHSLQKQAAAVALGSIGDPAAIEPLIWKLDDGDCYSEAWKALQKITGEHLPDNRGPWMEWWKKKKESLSKESSVPHMDATADAIAKSLASEAMDHFEAHLQQVTRVSPESLAYSASDYCQLLQAMVLTYLGRKAFIERYWGTIPSDRFDRWLPRHLLRGFISGDISLIESFHKEMKKRGKKEYAGGSLQAQFRDLQRAISENDDRLEAPLPFE